jgi:hypothetical protein
MVLLSPSISWSGRHVSSGVDNVKSRVGWRRPTRDILNGDDYSATATGRFIPRVFTGSDQSVYFAGGSRGTPLRDSEFKDRHGVGAGQADENPEHFQQTE